MQLNENGLLYHATLPENLPSILRKGLVPSVFDGLVYLPEDVNEAYRFVAMRLPPRHRRVISVLEIMVGILDESRIEMGVDHDPIFFRKRVFTYDRSIPAHAIAGIWTVDGEFPSHEVYYDSRDTFVELMERHDMNDLFTPNN